MKALDLRGLNPAPVTPFTRDGAAPEALVARLQALYRGLVERDVAVRAAEKLG